MAKKMKSKSSEKTKLKKFPKVPKKNIGESLESFLEEQGILQECKAEAIKSIIATQLKEILNKENVSQAELARKMKTSKAAVHRLLDPENSSITFNTLAKATSALGKSISIKIK